MGDRWEKQIQENHYLITDQMVQVEHVCDQLLSSHALTTSMVENISSERTHTARARALNQLMQKRGRDYYDRYFEALYDSGNKNLAKLLEKHVSPDVLRTEDALGGERIGSNAMVHPEQAGGRFGKTSHKYTIRVPGRVIEVENSSFQASVEGQALCVKLLLSSESALDDHMPLLSDGQIRQLGTKSLYVEIKETVVSEKTLSASVKFLQIEMSYFPEIARLYSDMISKSDSDYDMTGRTLIDEIFSGDNPKELKPLQEEFRNASLNLMSHATPILSESDPDDHIPMGSDDYKQKRRTVRVSSTTFKGMLASIQVVRIQKGMNTELDSDKHFLLCTLIDAMLSRDNHTQLKQIQDEFVNAAMKTELRYRLGIFDSDLDDYFSVRSEQKLLTVTKGLKGDRIQKEQLDSKLCTFTITQTEFMPQHGYYCQKCNMVDEEGVCEICAMVCHKDHEPKYAGFSRFYCDCGAKEDGSCLALVKRTPPSMFSPGATAAVTNSQPSETEALQQSQIIYTTAAEISNAQNAYVLVSSHDLPGTCTMLSSSRQQQQPTQFVSNIAVSTNLQQQSYAQMRQHQLGQQVVYPYPGPPSQMPRFSTQPQAQVYQFGRQPLLNSVYNIVPQNQIPPPTGSYSQCGNTNKPLQPGQQILASLQKNSYSQPPPHQQPFQFPGRAVQQCFYLGTTQAPMPILPHESQQSVMTMPMANVHGYMSQGNVIQQQQMQQQQMQQQQQHIFRGQGLIMRGNTYQPVQQAGTMHPTILHQATNLQSASVVQPSINMQAASVLQQGPNLHQIVNMQGSNVLQSTNMPQPVQQAGTMHPTIVRQATNMQSASVVQPSVNVQAASVLQQGPNLYQIVNMQGSSVSQSTNMPQPVQQAGTMHPTIVHQATNMQSASVVQPSATGRKVSGSTGGVISYM